MTSKELAGIIDYTLLRADATAEEVKALCATAVGLGVGVVCVAPSRVGLAVHELEASELKVCTVAGFPLGHEATDTKRMAVESAVDDGAQEVDVVMNLGWLKDGRDAQVVRELRDLVEAAEDRVVKVILETGLLTREDVVRACRGCVEAGVHFVKTSSGYGPRGASVEDVRLMRETVGQDCGVKAAGGIKDLATALAMVEAGATRIGTSSAPAILAGIIPAD